MENSYSKETMKRLRRSQRDEETGHLLYARMAKREKNKENAAILQKMSEDEKEHANTWRGYTGEDIKPDRLRVALLSFASVVLGYTFVLKRLQTDEMNAVADYQKMGEEIPDALVILEAEKAHEEALISMLDEERLQYVGAMVLGLNDALVELTGTIAGLTFAMQNTRIVALSGIITGISATLSMAASNYLAERASGNDKALKSSMFTGIAYLVTVALLVLPYLLFPPTGYMAALITMLVIVVVVILVFNYYISTAKSEPFLRRFVEMAVISLSVAALSFAIGLAAKELLGIDVG